MILQDGVEQQDRKQAEGNNQNGMMPFFLFFCFSNRLVINSVAHTTTSEQLILKWERYALVFIVLGDIDETNQYAVLQ